MSKKYPQSLWILIPSTSLAIILGVGGVIQFSEQVSSYFPWLSKYILQNSTAILFTIAASLAISFAALLYSYKQIREKLRIKDYSEARRKVILFLTPSPAGQFYLQHLSNLFIRAANYADADMQIYIVMHCPAQAFQKDFSPEQSLKLLKEFPAKVAGVFMIPSEPDEVANLNGIRSFHQTYPTVLLDVYPGTSFVKDMPPFIGGDEKKGGVLAAIMAIQWFRKINKNIGNILILKGRNSAWEMQRLESFVQKIKSELPNLAIYQSDELNYERRAAKDLIDRLTINRYALGPDHPLDFTELDIIYACNDEMAIGALESIQTFSSQNPSAHTPKIIGYDGIPKMIWLINNGNPHILGTVNVKVEEQADRALATMTTLLEGHSPNDWIDLVKPESVPNVRVLGM